MAFSSQRNYKEIILSFAYKNSLQKFINMIVLRNLIIFSMLFFADSKPIEDIVKEFITIQNRPTVIVSFLNGNTNYKLARTLSNTLIEMKSPAALKNDHVLFVAHLNNNKTIHLLKQAEELNLLVIPNRWLLIHEVKENISDGDTFNALNKHLSNFFFGINTEVYVSIISLMDYKTFSVYRMNEKSDLIWTPYETNVNTPVPMQRRNVALTPVLISTVITNNSTLKDLDNYLNRQVDTLTKYIYYMMRHLVDYVNGTYVMNVTDSWGYVQADGTFDGMVREMEEKRADIGGTTFVPAPFRLPVVEYVLTPAVINAKFIFKKPPLGTITNIYTLPFSRGVWLTTILSICVFSVALFFTYLKENKVNVNKKKYSKTQAMLNSTFDSIGLLFQQGIDSNPMLTSTRQVLLLALMTFMFLFTAYSANVVALLQTTTNDINNIETLLKSPLKLGLQNVLYAKYYFPTDTRTFHKALWKEKLEPQGDKALYNVKDGIKKLREGMFAFHVESPAAYDEIQKSFRDNEKCNLGEVTFMALTAPYIGVARNSHIKEQLKIGVRRIMEAGLQDRSTRRVVAQRPTCHSNVAMFSAVTFNDVAPAFKWLLMSYLIVISIVFIEIIVHLRGKIGSSPHGRC